MRFIVKFTDNEDQASKRQEFMQDHLQFLSNNSKSVLAAGPLLDQLTGAGDGGLWFVEADDQSQVQALVEEDPFYPTGLRKEISILEWKLVFEDGVRKI